MEGGQAEGDGCDPYSISSSGRVCKRMLPDQSQSPLQQPLQTLGAVTKKWLPLHSHPLHTSPLSLHRRWGEINVASRTHIHTHCCTNGCGTRNDRNKKDGFPPKRQYEGDVLKVHLKFLAAFHFISECLGLAPLKAQGDKSSLLLALRPL